MPGRNHLFRVCLEKSCNPDVHFHHQAEAAGFIGPQVCSHFGVYLHSDFFREPLSSSSPESHWRRYGVRFPLTPQE